MIKIVLPDNSVREIEPASAGEIAGSISNRLKNEALAAIYNGKAIDLDTRIDKDGELEFLTFEDEKGKDIFWHSSSHIMAQAVKELFPGTRIAIGPAIDNGFYYDFDRDEAFTESDLEKIEKRMHEIAGQKQVFKRKVLERNEALEFFKNINEDYKVELISELPDGQEISIYTVGSFTDLCRGPHIPDTGYVKKFKLLSIAGAYWRGDSEKKMLQRIYGISFPKAKMLKEYLDFLEEAKKRDHRKLGKELELFMFDDKVGQGLPIWLPKGALMRKIIEDFWKNEHLRHGYQLLNTPHIGKSELWETSGHLDFYRDSMYSAIKIDDVDYYAKPMNCPFHLSVYKNSLHSYRDLPLKYAELGTVYRYELSGALHGLLRVRGFTQDDAHIIVTPEQLEEEIIRTVDFSIYMLRSFGLNQFDIYISTKPEKYHGTDEEWETTTKSLETALEKNSLEYRYDVGGGVFYGPKIDIKVKDVLGRTWQCSTIQFDFNLPTKFDMTYIGEDGHEHKPYVIHRALLGSLERFFGVLIEHYAGRFPTWLAPVQAVIIPVSDKYEDFARKAYDSFIKENIRTNLDNRSSKVGYKIHEAEEQKIPYIMVLGEKEQNGGDFPVRKSGRIDLGTMNMKDIIDRIKYEDSVHKDIAV